MIVSDSRNFIFIHLFKTAGESIRHSLEPWLPRGDRIFAADRSLLGTYLGARRWVRTGIGKHSLAVDVRDWIGRERFLRYYRFASVRDPLDRIQSYYRYLGDVAERRSRPGFRNQVLSTRLFQDADPMRRPAMRARLETSDFSGFIRHPLLAADLGGRPQAEVLCDEQGELLVDFTIRYDRLESDFAVVKARLGLPDAVLGWKNRSANSERRRPISDEDRDFLRGFYARDYEIFGF